MLRTYREDPPAFLATSLVMLTECGLLIWAVICLVQL